MKRLLTTFVSIASGIATVQFIHNPVCLAQTATSNQNSTVGANSNFNQVLQNNPQVPINSVNTTNIRVPNIYPLQNLPNAYVNTENDFGMNLSVGVNTLDASNVTVYLGLIYQPGRSADHQARMARLRKETEVLEVQKKNMESNLTLLQKQIEEANLRLQKLQKTP
ncbi:MULTISPECIES: hypothetical protein [Leptolyngbya]|jgi:hypothetical protein|uniref:Uncharacterized protein n=1 Tax=Leptolyngbya boryana NIES-2135 TaxID=1973484 RepID=A0A1Z4JJY7_LEPBY|nr:MULTISPECIES: hypothetical protein [Leptolyngbya]BAY57072.1 hypothetical protein NIES2135_39360 [Leptolyngbya boryana NIES-2135]MCY6494369.1 hypothetical protein [Leptolyngbya sp. GGD]ULP28202.1 hypothetical protein MCP04_19595 [Leptolyngbya boryana IU 594]BAS56747.1 hypothetical protein LBWT_26710 [Leptolyngbya boryana IAM M-101]BAS63095.1 hypothetical protein LBDG_26710 [Leptolyngbya boryana dg5]